MIPNLHPNLDPLDAMRVNVPNTGCLNPCTSRREEAQTEAIKKSRVVSSAPKTRGFSPRGLGFWSFVILWSFVISHWSLSPALAFPPAPYHLLYGTVRDRYGTPLTTVQARIVLQSPSGIQVAGPVIPGLSAGINYQLKVSMDASPPPDLYQPDALFAAAPFKMVVVIGTVTNNPIEMSGSFAALGQPGKTTRIDLTLGVDANGDGIPDAWEYAFLATLGTNISLASLNANSVLTPDGRTLRQQYLLGTYPFDPGDPLQLRFMGFNGPSAVLEFPTVTGRSYTVLGSTDLINYSPVAFALASDGPGGPTRTFYYAPGIATIQVHVPPSPSGPTTRFYRIQVQ